MWRLSNTSVKTPNPDAQWVLTKYEEQRELMPVDIIKSEELVHPMAMFELFKCPICLQLLKQTMATPCLHRFCQNCINKSLATIKECPTCRCTIRTSRSLRKDFAFDELIQKIYPKVACSSKVCINIFLKF